MHELSIVASLLETIVAHAKRKDISRINRCRLIVGEMAPVSISTLQFALEHLVAGTILEGANWEFSVEKSEGKCKLCAKSFRPTPPFFSCPYCNGGSLFVKGREIYIDYYEGE